MMILHHESMDQSPASCFVVDDDVEFAIGGRKKANFVTAIHGLIILSM